MSDQLVTATTALLQRDFGLQASKTKRLTEGEVVQLLADEIDHLMQTRMEWLLSLLYRMDVSETLVNEALHPASPVAANIGLARLVYARQKRRAYTKATYKPQPLEDEDLAW